MLCLYSSCSLVLTKNRKSFSKKGPERRELSIVWPIIIVVFHPWVSNRMKMVDAVFLACDANQVSHRSRTPQLTTHVSHTHTPPTDRHLSLPESVHETTSHHHTRIDRQRYVLRRTLNCSRAWVLGRTLNCSRNVSWAGR